MRDAAQTMLSRQKAERIRLPKSIADIPRDCLVYPRQPRNFGRTEDFLKLLDSEVRKAPAVGVSMKDAVKLMERFGGAKSEHGIYLLLSRTIAQHTLTVYKGHVRLSTRELIEKINRVA